MFLIGLKTRLRYILRTINASNLKLKFFEILGKFIYREIILYRGNPLETDFVKKKKSIIYCNQQPLNNR